jgi:hypothetical protein
MLNTCIANEDGAARCDRQETDKYKDEESGRRTVLMSKHRAHYAQRKECDDHPTHCPAGA